MAEQSHKALVQKCRCKSYFKFKKALKGKYYYKMTVACHEIVIADATLLQRRSTHITFIKKLHLLYFRKFMRTLFAK